MNNIEIKLICPYIGVKQYVLVSERIGYVDRAKEVIYNALNAAGITIAFPQCDVHLIKEN